MKVLLTFGIDNEIHDKTNEGILKALLTFGIDTLVRILAGDGVMDLDRRTMILLRRRRVLTPGECSLAQLAVSPAADAASVAECVDNARSSGSANARHNTKLSHCQCRRQYSSVTEASACVDNATSSWSANARHTVSSGNSLIAGQTM